MSKQPVVHICDLEKNFKSTRALSGVNLDLVAGSVVGVLGPNGCGKTSLFKQIVGMHKPSRGTVNVFGTPTDKLDDEQVARIGYVSQQSELLDWLTVGETLDFVRAHYLSWDDGLAERLVKDFELDRNRKVGQLSVGQKQRLGIVVGVSHGPDLLILDEPAASLDPIA